MALNHCGSAIDHGINWYGRVGNKTTDRISWGGGGGAYAATLSCNVFWLPI